MLLFSVPERGRASINVGLRHAFLHSMESSRVLVYVHEMSKNWRIMVRQKCFMMGDGLMQLPLRPSSVKNWLRSLR